MIRQEGRPPDPFKPPAYDTDFPANWVASQRRSNLPIPNIVTKLGDYFSRDRLIPSADDDAGDFVSNYMAYLVAWYREWWNVQSSDPKKTCRLSGHTHVGAFVKPSDAEYAFRLQLDVVIDKLDSM